MAESVVVTKKKIRNGNELVEEHIWTWIASTAGTLTTTAGPLIVGWLAEAETNPGTPSPTDNYDVTLTNADGLDVLGGEGADRSATITQTVLPKIGNGYGEKFVNSILSLNLTNNSVASAQGIFKIRVRKVDY